MKKCILSERFLKLMRQFQLGKKDVGVDVWSVILLKVDPHNIFKCILVSKSCLEVITSPYFRIKYLEKWKDSLKDCLNGVIGFMYRDGEFKIDITKQLGFLLNNTKLTRGHLIFRSKSSSGLILCADRKKYNLYVFNFASFSGSVIVTPLPPPPVNYFSPGMDIISDDDASFKVVMADFNRYHRQGEWTSIIQTFCSSTWTWEKLELSCCDVFRLEGSHPGLVGNKGMLYWPAKTWNDCWCLAAYDARSPEEGRIRMISLPLSYERLNTYFGVTPEGNVKCVTTQLHPYCFQIRIWELNDEAGDWKLLCVMDESVWDGMDELAGDERDHREHPFEFVSFVPGRPDSIFVVRIRRYFIYNIHTKMLDRFEGLSDYRGWGRCCEGYVPLTLADLGVWPSSPFSNHHSQKKSRNTFSRLHPSLICH